MSEDDFPTSALEDSPQVTIGSKVYVEDGTVVGQVRGFDEHGFYVSAEEGIEGLSIEHSRSGHEFGEAELMWRCGNCGEMGEIDEGTPENCPDCGAPSEEIFWWTED